MGEYRDYAEAVDKSGLAVRDAATHDRKVKDEAIRWLKDRKWVVNDGPSRHSGNPFLWNDPDTGGWFDFYSALRLEQRRAKRRFEEG